MLTNIYYFNFYKPYILRTQGSNSATAVKRKKITQKDNFENVKDAAFLLNKSLKTDVIQYARNVSSNVVSVKNSSKQIIRNMEDFNKNVYKEDLPSAKKLLSEDLDKLVSSYNTASDFLSNQSHSQSLTSFSEQLQSTLRYSGDKISMLGLQFDEEGKLAYDEDYFQSLNQGTINIAIGENLNVMHDMYEDAREVLQSPLTEHMQFKSLGYYYNYKLGVLESDTFKILESGMIIDQIV